MIVCDYGPGSAGNQKPYGPEPGAGQRGYVAVTMSSRLFASAEPIVRPLLADLDVIERRLEIRDRPWPVLLPPSWPPTSQTSCSS